MLELRKQGLRAVSGAVITHQQAQRPERLPMNRIYLLPEVRGTVEGGQNNLNHQSAQPHLRK